MELFCKCGHIVCSAVIDIADVICDSAPLLVQCGPSDCSCSAFQLEASGALLLPSLHPHQSAWERNRGH